MEFEAVRLFVERATAADPSFAISDCNASAIAHICRRLDGLPIAIELAAARVRVLAIQQIAAHLDESFDVLEQNRHTGLPHHQTLKAAFDWSYDLLSSKERLLLECLSVFAGSFTLAAVDAVCGNIEGLYPDKMLTFVARLVDRSLLTTVTAPFAEERRYRLLETIRQYGSHKLRPDLKTILAGRHAEFFLCVAEEIQPSITSAAWGACFMRLNREYDNLRAALQWSRSDDSGSGLGLRMAAAIWRYWLGCGHWHEGLNWLEATLERSAGAPAQARAEALCGAGQLIWCLYRDKRGRVRLEESVTLWRTTENVRGLGGALHLLGSVMASLGELEAAKRLNEESVDVLRRAGAAYDLAVALGALGQVARLQGRFSDAEVLYHESEAALRVINDPWALRYPLHELAILAARQGQYDRAEAYWRESFSLVLPLEQMPHLSREIQGLAEVALARGNHAHAARLFGAAETIRESANIPAWEIGHFEYISSVNELRTALGEAAFCTLWAEGRKLSHDRANLIELASQ
jgi:tetratricopeptide (TPR) repeat protein